MQTVPLSVGHTANMSLVFTDQNGNPMLVQPTPDASPVTEWSDVPGSPPIGALVAAGNAATELAENVGTDVVSVTTFVGGTPYTGQVALAVSPAPQQLTGVTIAVKVT